MKVKRSQNRLYKLIIETEDFKCLMSKVDQVHVNYHALALMFKERMVRGLPKITQPHEVCNECIMAKQEKKAVPSCSSFSAKKVLELVHTGPCGPITPTTAFGEKYFLLFVDN